MDPIVPKPRHPLGIPLPLLLLAAAVMAFLPRTLPRWRVANGQLEDRNQGPLDPEGALWMNWAGRLSRNLSLEGSVVRDDAHPIDDFHLRPVDIEKACLLVGGEQMVSCSLGSPQLHSGFNGLEAAVLQKQRAEIQRLRCNDKESQCT
jgi:hypothetical protein